MALTIPVASGRRQYAHRRGYLSVLVLVTFLSACAHSISREPAEIGIDLPGTFSLYEKTAPAPDRWWERFGSEELNGLIGDALSGSPTLKASLARLRQARSLVVQARGDKVPDLAMSADASETRRRAGGQVSSERSRSLSLASTYEIDLWGRLDAGHSAAALEYEATREDLYTAAMSMASEVALKWLETISVRRQLSLLDEQLETNKTILELLELRYLKGLATALDIYQQRQIVAETRAAFPPLESRLKTLSGHLAVLTGRPPRTNLGLTTDTFPDPGDLPETGIPAELLARRPDIRSAGLRLRAAEQKVAAARAGRLPSVNLSATAGYRAGSFADLLDNWFATLAAGLVHPLFNSGSLDAEVERQRSIADERLAAYEQVVLEAIEEVEDAMMMERKQVEYITALEEQLAIAKDSFREAQRRYRKGLIDYLPALSALISTQRFERTVVQARLERLNQRVKLHRALGGGWMEEVFEQADRSSR